MKSKTLKKCLVLSLIGIVMLGVCDTWADAADVKLAWDANTEPNVAGYKIHWSTVNTIPFSEVGDVGNIMEYTITGLADDTTYFIAATAYDDQGHESEYSNIIEYVVHAGRVIIRVLDRPRNIKVVW